MRVYKLTDENMRTYGNCQWKIGEWKKTDGKGELCGPGWLHCYSSPLLAILLNPIHADFDSPRLFIAETKGRGKHDKGLKSGYSEMRLIKEIAIPKITLTQKVAFGILCAKEVYKDQSWNNWANKRLNGKDRSDNAAANAAYAAYAAHAANATANAAAANAAHAAAYAAHDAYAATNAAAYAATNAANAANMSINFIKIANDAMVYKD
jgi:hypothetical protein